MKKDKVAIAIAIANIHTTNSANFCSAHDILLQLKVIQIVNCKLVKLQVVLIYFFILCLKIDNVVEKKNNGYEQKDKKKYLVGFANKK